MFACRAAPPCNAARRSPPPLSQHAGGTSGEKRRCAPSARQGGYTPGRSHRRDLPTKRDGERSTYHLDYPGSLRGGDSHLLFLSERMVLRHHHRSQREEYFPAQSSVSV